MGNNVLVTGGCGFVGRHLVRKLADEGNEVWIVDDLSTGKHPSAWLADWVSTASGERTSYSRDGRRVHFVHRDLVALLREQKQAAPPARLPRFEEAYHLAAVVGGRAVLIEDHPIDIAANLSIDATFFDWAVERRGEVGCVLYMSSSVAYPERLQSRAMAAPTAMREAFLDARSYGDVGLPESIYGWVKVNGEYLAGLAAKRYGMSVACARPFSGYGGDQDSTYPIPSIALRAARREDPLVVWGSGEQTRDFVYIDDFVDALCLIARKVHDGSGVNVGAGESTAFKDVARIMAELEGYTPRIQPRTDKAEGGFTILADPALLRGLGWAPRYSVRAGFAKVLEGVKRNL